METTGTFIAEALSRLHTRLLTDLRELQDEIRTPSSEGLATLRARLDATLEHIIDHFRFEETNGYMSAVLEKEPRLERSIQHLAEEHQELTRSLDALIAEANAAETVDDGFRKRVRNWIERVRRHESRENELVQDAFSSDIAAED